MKKLFEIAKSIMDQQLDFVFVTIIASSGSSPRGAGARMLVLADGTSYGTIGGGAIEHQSVRQAREVLAQKESCAKGYRLRSDQAADLGMVCGGDVTVYFQYISCEDRSFYDICCRIVSTWDAGEDSWLILDITDTRAWSAGFYSGSAGPVGVTLPDMTPLLRKKALQTSVNGRTYYSEPLIKSGVVYIFGGGHVAQELLPLLSHIGFRCVIFDDREEFSRPALFPDAVRCITGDFSCIGSYLTINAQDYVCIMSRGHQYDYLLQKQVLQTPARYIGVMGSRKKKDAIQKMLLDDGCTREQLARIVTPIGLDILAETPAEIAVSIAGELIRLRAQEKS